jgi:acid phosphatase
MSGCKLIVPPKVMVIMMENKDFSEVIGQTAAAPYTNQLAQQYGLSTEAYSYVHPSLPNYLEFASGSNQGISDNLPPSAHTFPAVTTLADQLVSAGYSAAAYAEDLPADPTNDSGNYAVRHVPWEYFPSAPIAVKDSSALIPDLNSSAAPDFVWYTPNLINDGDNGTVQQGDAFLATLIPEIQATSWYKTGGQIIITWDESDTDSTSVTGGQNGGGHIPTIVVSQDLAARPQVYSGKVATAGILGSIEHLYLLPYLGDAAVASNGNINSMLYW